jgi:hypothetical protein
VLLLTSWKNYWCHGCSAQLTDLESGQGAYPFPIERRPDDDLVDRSPGVNSGIDQGRHNIGDLV